MIFTGNNFDTNQKGFNLGDVTSWKCDKGYQTFDKRTESVAECLADGSWSNQLSCIRVRCERPIEKQPNYEFEECRNSGQNKLCISEDRKANAYRLVDNKLVEYRNGQKYRSK